MKILIISQQVSDEDKEIIQEYFENIYPVYQKKYSYFFDIFDPTNKETNKLIYGNKLYFNVILYINETFNEFIFYSLAKLLTIKGNLFISNKFRNSIEIKNNKILIANKSYNIINRMFDFNIINNELFLVKKDRYQDNYITYLLNYLCKNFHYNLLMLLPKKIIKLFYDLSLYSIDNKQGNIVLANKIKNMLSLSNEKNNLYRTDKTILVRILNYYLEKDCNKLSNKKNFFYYNYLFTNHLVNINILRECKIQRIQDHYDSIYKNIIYNFNEIPKINYNDYFESILLNPNITFEIIKEIEKKYSDKYSSYKRYLLRNNTIEWKDILKLFTEEEIIKEIDMLYNPNIPIEFIKKHINNIDWRWNIVLRFNKNITYQFIINNVKIFYRGDNSYFEFLYDNPYISMYTITKINNYLIKNNYIDSDDFYDFMSKNVNNNISNIKDLYYSNNKKTYTNFYNSKDYPHLNTFIGFSANANLSIEDIENNMDLPWIWFEIVGNPSFYVNDLIKFIKRNEKYIIENITKNFVNYQDYNEKKKDIKVSLYKYLLKNPRLTFKDFVKVKKIIENINPNTDLSIILTNNFHNDYRLKRYHRAAITIQKYFRTNILPKIKKESLKSRLYVSRYLLEKIEGFL